MLRFLIAESETATEREARRQRAGKSSGETFQATLKELVEGADIERIAPADGESAVLSPEDISAFDAVFVTGSPLHVYDDTPEVRRQIEFMRAVFASGVPSFGSCAGLQLAVAAAGGTVRSMPRRMEAGLARRITATKEGCDHPLLAGRPPAWDAAAIHTDEVEHLPEGSTLLAGNGATRVQAAEIVCGSGVFWGVQYHPELAPGEIAVALRHQAASLVKKGLAHDEKSVERLAALLDRLHDEPTDNASRWELGIDAQFAQQSLRRLELTNFIAHVRDLREKGRVNCDGVQEALPADS